MLRTAVQIIAHPPLPAIAEDDHGGDGGITGNHLNRAAGSGCHDEACSPSSFLYRGLLG
jgi:hypothetical protein